MKGGSSGEAGSSGSRWLVMALGPVSWRIVDLVRALAEIGVPIYIIGRDGRFEWLNRAGVDLIGDLRGKTYVLATAVEDRARARTNFARKVVGGASTAYDLTILDRGGKRLAVRITSVPLWQEERITGVFGVVIPQADRRDMESLRRRDVALTPRQLEVLGLLAKGLETREIAKQLAISPETARNHIRGLMRQLGAHSRLEAILIAIRWGLVDPHAG